MEAIMIKKRLEKSKSIAYSKKEFAETFKALHNTSKKIKEEDVVDLIHTLRREWKKEKL